MENKKFYIGDIANFFQIPSSTLRFWETKGLLSPNKKSENQYREYDLPDFMKISDIIFYKNLGIPLKNIIDLKKKDTSEQINFCSKHMEQLHQQQIFLQQQIQKLKQHQKALETIRLLERSGFLISEIDTEYIAIFELTDKEKLKMYIDNPYLYSRVQHTSDLQKEQRGITLTPKQAEHSHQIIWKKPAHSQYVVCLMKEEITSGYPNTLESLVKKVQEKYETGSVISRFLTSASENNKVYDFYKTYIEVKKKTG